MIKFLPILLMLCMNICSCSKDDGSNPDKKGNNNTQIDFIGHWEVSEIKINGEYVPASETCFKGSWSEFKKDKSYSSRNNCDNQTYQGSYVATDGTILCKVGGSNVVYKVISRSGNFIEFNMNDGANNIDMKAAKK